MKSVDTIPDDEPTMSTILFEKFLKREKKRMSPCDMEII
jgi:hypothetical protein